jgi:hypothetical protein
VSRVWRVARTIVSLAVAVGSFLVVTVAPARGACAAPSISLLPSSVASPGDTVTVVGASWGTDCNDVVSSPSCSHPPPLGRPADGIELRMTGPSQLVPRLGVVNADDAYRFELSIQLPQALAPGTYRIEAQHDQFSTFVDLTVTSG